MRPDEVIFSEGPWQHRTVSANGARFHLAEMGDGPLVLLLHGFPLFWWTWRHQLESFAAAGYRAVAMDLRGYGGSDHTPRGYDPYTGAADVAGVIRSLGAADAIIVGHGRGGQIAWTAATTEPKVVRRLVVVAAAHPRRTRAAMVANPRQVAASRYQLSFQAPWLPERRLVRDNAASVSAYLHAWSAAGWPDDTTSQVYRTAMRSPYTAYCVAEYFRWALRSMPRPDGMRYFADMGHPVTVPVLQLHGAHDPCVLPSTAQGSGRYVEAPYRWRSLDGVGHFPHEEAPERFAAELLGWLADNEPDR